MPAYTSTVGGPTILATLRAKLTENRAAITRVTNDDSLPVEYRRRVRNESITDSLTHIREAQVAFSTWAKAKDADARRRLASDPVGSAAEEARRNTNEMRFGRLVDSARSSGTPRNVATGYAEQAQEAYLAGRYDEAIVLARAAREVGGNGLTDSTARQVIEASRAQLDLADPEKASAFKDIAEAEKGVRAFTRDINAALADTYTAAEAAARAIGDDPTGYAKAAVGPSMVAKAIAVADAEVTYTDDGQVAGTTGYVHPEGTLAAAPMGVAARGKGEAVANTTTGSVRVE